VFDSFSKFFFYSKNILCLSHRISEEVFSMIAKSEPLRENVGELVDVLNADGVRLELFKHVDSFPSSQENSSKSLRHLSSAFSEDHCEGRGGLKLSALGSIGECEIIIPQDADIFVSFHRPRHPELLENSAWQYPMTSFQLGMKALSVAKETNIQINREGQMFITHQVETTKGIDTYVDFIMTPLISMEKEGEPA
jgi:hypothetical protein